MSTVTVKTKQIQYPKKVEIRVGILEPGASHGDGMTVGELAEVHEYGLGNVPARAPIRAFHDTKSEQIKRQAMQQFEAAARGRGDVPAFQRAAELVAVKAAAELRNTITEGLEPPIAESTEKRKIAKGFSPPFTPLVETGVLRNSYAGDAKVTP